MEKENEENGLEKRREECDLGEVEGKRETHSLSLSVSRSHRISPCRGCIDRKKRDDGVVDDDDDDEDDEDDEEERGCRRSRRKEGKGRERGKPFTSRV